MRDDASTAGFGLSGDVQLGVLLIHARILRLISEQKMNGLV